MKKLLFILLLFTSCSTNHDLTYTLYQQENTKIHLFKINPQTYSFHIANNSENPKTIHNWQQELNSPLLINAFYFHQDQTPSGYLEINNQIIQTTKFDLDKSGLFLASPTPQIIDTETQNLDFTNLTSAGQSFPFLIKNGQNPIKEDSGKIARRTFIGQDQQGFIYIGATRNFLSLYQLAELLVDTNIPFQYVLNLDGGPSTGLHSKDLQIHSITKVPSIIYLQKNE